MTRLPKKYFKSISDYVKTYYTAYGAKRADKLYDAVKTVTKDFTRTDPVHVRIGEDGEPEIHYTMTQATGTSYFTFRNYVNADFHLHNAKILSTANSMFEAQDFDAITIDELPDGINFYCIFNGLNNSYHLKSVTLLNVPKPKGSMRYAFNSRKSLLECPAIDCSDVTDLSYAFSECTSMTAMHMTNMKVSFGLSSTALKHDAILEVFNNLGKVTAGSGITLTLGDEKKALMTTEEIKIATDKGWEVA